MQHLFCHSSPSSPLLSQWTVGDGTFSKGKLTSLIITVNGGKCANLTKALPHQAPEQILKDLTPLPSITLWLMSSTCVTLSAIFFSSSFTRQCVSQRESLIQIIRPVNRCILAIFRAVRRRVRSSRKFLKLS